MHLVAVCWLVVRAGECLTAPVNGLGYDTEVAVARAIRWWG